MRSTLLAALVCGAVLPAEAQSVRVRTRSPDGTAAPGVVVLLLAANDSVVARALTGANGTAILRSAAPGAFHVRALRIGQLAVTIGPLTLRANEQVERDLTLTHRPITLARIDVRARDLCRTNPDSGLLVAQLLAEARTALYASVARTEDGEMRARYSVFTSNEDTRGRSLGMSSFHTVERATHRPFASLPPDSIVRVGYVETAGDTLTYRAPDAEVLLSRSFAGTHCFQVVDHATRSASIGVAFRPVESRPDITDIRGVIWLARDSLALEEVEFTYDPTSHEERSAGVGGIVRFDRAENGAWFVSTWTLRMPRYTIRTTPARIIPRPTPARSVRILDEIVVAGGDVLSLTLGGVPQYATAALPSARSAPADSAPPIPRCSGADLSPDSGAVIGRVADMRSAAIGAASIRAEWQAAHRIVGSTVSYRTQSVRTVTNDAGQFELCNVPLGVPLTVVASWNHWYARPHVARVTVAQRVVRIDPQIQTDVASAASGTAVVSFDTLRLRPRAPEGRMAEIDARIRARRPNVAITRAELDRRRPVSLSHILRGISGIEIADSSGVKLPVSSRRGRLDRSGDLPPCVLRVLVDGSLMSTGLGIDVVAPADVHAIEVYFGPSRVPPQLASLPEGGCGLIAIWTRVTR